LPELEKHRSGWSLPAPLSATLFNSTSLDKSSLFWERKPCACEQPPMKNVLMFFGIFLLALFVNELIEVTH
jgi:hypothetical protein